MPEPRTPRPARPARTAPAIEEEVVEEIPDGTSSTKVSTVHSGHTDAGTDRIIVLALLTLGALCIIGAIVASYQGKQTGDFLVTSGGACIGALAMRAKGGSS